MNEALIEILIIVAIIVVLALIVVGCKCYDNGDEGWAFICLCCLIIVIMVGSYETGSTGILDNKSSVAVMDSNNAMIKEYNKITNAESLDNIFSFENEKGDDVKIDYSGGELTKESDTKYIIKYYNTTNTVSTNVESKPVQVNLTAICNDSAELCVFISKSKSDGTEIVSVEDVNGQFKVLYKNNLK